MLAADGGRRRRRCLSPISRRADNTSPYLTHPVAKMDYENFFTQRVGELRSEGRYRVFANLERHCGRFPRAYHHRSGEEVTVWCSNDYLGMGQHPAVFDAMIEAVRCIRRG